MTVVPKSSVRGLYYTKATSFKETPDLVSELDALGSAVVDPGEGEMQA